MKYTINKHEILELKRKKIARLSLHRALRRMEIKKSDECELCGNTEVHLSGHHKDYGKPLNVIWLCDRCHGLVHHKNHELNPNNNPQTRTPCYISNDCMAVTFYLPAKNLIALKNKVQEKNSSLSKVIRDIIVSEFPVDDGQLEFKF